MAGRQQESRVLGEDRQVTRFLGRGAAVVLLLGVVLTGCSSDEQPEAASTPSATPPPTTAAPVPPRPDPRPGECRELTFRQATRSVDTTRPTPCDRDHSSVTFKVGHLDLVVDGHLMAADSARVQGQLDQRCREALPGWLGGDRERLRLSQFRAVWFRPEVVQADRGASWFRCDVVAVAGDDRLARFTGDLKGVLNDESGLDRFGRCGTSSPTRKNFRAVICQRPHSWRAVSVVDFPDSANYLGRNAARDADEACQDEATSRTQEDLRYEWAFQWPTREEWNAGERYGWCWLPD